MGPLSEFYFETGQQGIKGLVLSIPRVGVIVDDRKNVRIWIPEKGVSEINKTVELGGFPVVFEKIHRVAKNKVRIDVNMGYEPAARESLQSFKLDGSYAADYEQKTGALKTLELEINPNQWWVTLKLFDPLIYKQGPWEIKF